MRYLNTFIFLLVINYGFGQVVLNADGSGDTYELISSVLAPNYNPIEVPDCNHAEFGAHIDEVFDAELNTHVFRFHIHVSPDNDRCKNFDRQRNEIKAYDKSPDNLLGIENEKVVYQWKFKLAEGFQSSPNFTHLHQLKSVGGALESMPMYTLTTRKGSPDRLELRYAETDSQVTLTRTDLAPFIGSWLAVTETITYGFDGTYEINIKRVSDGAILLEYANESIINWRPAADFVRPKWGIYRSLLNDQDLRDEEVLYADFSVEEIDLLSSNPSTIQAEEKIIFSNPVKGRLHLSHLPTQLTTLQIFSIDGKIVLDEKINASTATIDVSTLPKGMYILNFRGQQTNQASLVVFH